MSKYIGIIFPDEAKANEGSRQGDSIADWRRSSQGLAALRDCDRCHVCLGFLLAVRATLVTSLRPHRIGGRRSDFFTAGKLALGNLGLFQQHRSKREAAFFGLISFRRLRTKTG
jgi:hypothetical protein